MLPASPLLRSNRRLRDTHRGLRCFILGSGGSILDQDLTPLADEIVITQNHFHSHPHIDIIRPDYHCVVPRYQPREYDSDWISWFRDMEGSLPKTTTLITGASSKPLLDEQHLFTDRVVYLSPKLDPLFLRRARVDITRNVMRIPTALTQCLTVALYMGFSTIYLVGFDLDQLCHGREKNWGRFYGVSPVTANEAEKSEEDELNRTGGNWLAYWLMWRQFVMLGEYAVRKGTRIVNLTKGGLLNCYPREDYDEVVSAFRA